MQNYLHFITYYGSGFVLEHFDKSLHVRSSNTTCVQNFRPVPLTVFEMLGFKLKNKNNIKKKKNWKNKPFAISPMFVVQFSDIHILALAMYHPVVSKVDYH